MSEPGLTGEYGIATGGSLQLPKVTKPPEGKVINLGLPELTGNYTNQLDAKKVADVYPISQITGVPIDQLYAGHKEVKEVVQQKRDEGNLRSLEAAISIANDDLRKSWLGWQQLIGVSDIDFDFEIAKLEKRMTYESQFVIDDGLFSKATNIAAGLIPMAWSSMKEGLRGGLLTGMALGGATAIATPPITAAATAAGFVAGSAAFSASYIDKIATGRMALTLRGLKDSEGNPIDPRIIRTFSLAAGVVEGALEVAQVKLLLKTIPGLDKMMQDVVRNSVTKLIKDGSVASFLTGAAGRYAKFLAGETAIELAQETSSMIMEEVAKTVHNISEEGQLEHTTADKILDVWWDTTVSSVLGFGILGAPGHAVQILPGLIDRRSQVKNKQLQDVLPPDTDIDFSGEIKNTYERVKNTFFGKRDVRVLKNKNEGRVLREELKGLVEENQTAEELAVAISLYIDSKNNPEVVEAALRGERIIKEEEKIVISSDLKGVPLKPKKVKKLTKPLSDTKIRLIEMSKTLTKNQKVFADKIEKLYEGIAEEALGDEVIFNTLNNFVSRSWISDKKTKDIISTLTQTTIHAKERRLPTIVEGWTEGLEMKSHSVIDNLIMYRDTLIKTIEQKRFVNALKKGKTTKGSPIFTIDILPGYARIDMPTYSFANNAVYYAPEKIAKNINNIFGVSKLYDIVGVEKLTVLNAMLKKIALSTSLFHNIAFLRSYYLGGKTMHWENMNFFTAHREGVEMIHNMNKIVELGVYNGLTISLIQDWEEELLIMGSDLDKITAKYTKSKRIRTLVSDLWRRQVEFTFGVQGAGLKVKAFTYEFLNEQAKNPDQNINDIAARVAMLMNDDFGGLHLERIGRNKTLQHIFRLVALAPDWTESNVRTVTGMFKRVEKGGYKAQRQLYRKFWARVILKSAMATAMMNVILAGGDIEEAYKRWQKGVKKDWKNIASVDITPIWNLFGQEPRDRKYFSISGHFLDPIKYTAIPLGEPKILQYKASMLARLFTDWLFNENWRGKRFKNLTEIPMGVKEFTDYFDPDTYVTYKPVKRRGEFFEEHFSFPAFFIHSLIGSSPIAFQNLLACISGEQDTLSGIFNTLGIRQPRTKRKRRY